MTDFNFELVSPERILMSESIEHVVLPGSEGQLGVLAGHLPTVVTLKPGMINILSGATITRSIYVRGGFAEINAEETTVLVEHAIDVETANQQHIAKELAIAEQNLADADNDDARFIAQSALDALQSIKF